MLRFTEPEPVVMEKQVIDQTMDLRRAQRNLELAGDGGSEDGDMELGRLPMTQVCGLFDDSAGDVFLSTQVQGRIDDVEAEERYKGELKSALDRFSYTQEQEQEELQQPQEEQERKQKQKRKQKRKQRQGPLPSARVASRSQRPSKRREKSNRIKSITQFNTESFQQERNKDRTRTLIALLSGKRTKIRDVIERLELEKEQERPTQAEVFSTYNEEEWKSILHTLRENFPHCEKSEIRSLHRCIYGSDAGVWHSSQLPPEDMLVAEDQDFQAGLEVLDEQRGSQSVFTLSQLMEAERTGLGEDEEPLPNDEVRDLTKPLLIQNNFAKTQSQAEFQFDFTGDELFQTDVRAVAEEYDVDPPGQTTVFSEDDVDGPDLPSVISDTTDNGSFIEIDDEITQKFKQRVLDAQNGGRLQDTDEHSQPELHQNFNLHAVSLKKPSSVNALTNSRAFSSQICQLPEIQTLRRSPSRIAINDQLIDLTQESFKAVASIVSPVRRASQKEIQVPATRTTTMNEVENLECKRHSDPSRTQSKTIRFKIYKDSKLLDNLPLLEEFETRIVEDNEAIKDSEDDGDYSVLELEPRSCPVEEVVAASEPGIVSEELIAQDIPPTLPSTQVLRESLKTIGLKPCRSRTQMLEYMDIVSQNLNSQNDMDKKQEIFNELNSLVEQTPAILEKVYTFEPLSLVELSGLLAHKNPFLDYVDESTIREWADRQGICFTNG